MKSQLRDGQSTSTEMDTNTSRTTTTIDNNFAMNQLQELHDTIALLGSGAETLNEDAQQLNTNLLEHQVKLQRLTENIANVKLGVEEASVLLDGVGRNLDILNQDLISLKEKIDDMQYVSYDGTFIWKITGVREKMSK
jgi:predicted  nucleic acid-binding Zn-ribbon protein